jgi:DNA-binding MarR family transcriptional regulator
MLVQPAGGRNGRPRRSAMANKDQSLVRRLTWSIASMGHYLDEMHRYRAKSVKASGPQWLIILALADLDENGLGAAVSSVANKLHVNASFVTTQSQILEKKGLLRRRRSDHDARVVRMSLTDTAYAHITKIASEQAALSEFIFTDFTEKQLAALTHTLTLIDARLQKARLKLEAGI